MSVRGVSGRLLRNPWLIQAAVAVALLGLAAWQINLAHVARSFKDARYGWLLLALSIYVVARAVHAFEWQITLNKVGRAPFVGLFGALLIGTLVNAVIPASAGDVVKIQVIANRYGLPRAGLVAGRGAEAVVNSVILVMFIMVSFALPGLGFASPHVLWLLTAAAAAAFVASIAASRMLPDTLPPGSVLTRLPRRLYEILERQWPRLYDGFEVIRRPRLLVVALALNLVGWGIDIVIYWTYGQAFNLQLPFAAYLSVTVIVALITVFPITFGNIGTFELGIVSVLALHGIGSDEALAYAAGTHIFSTVFNIALGLLAMWSMGVQPRDVLRLRPRPHDDSAVLPAPDGPRPNRSGTPR